MSEANTQLLCELDAPQALPHGLLAEFLECAPLPVVATCGSNGRLYLNAEARSLWSTAEAGAKAPSCSPEDMRGALQSVFEAPDSRSASAELPCIRLPDGDDYGIDTFTWGSAPDAAWNLAILRPLLHDSSEGELFRHKVGRLKAIVHEMRNTLTAAKEALAFVQEGALGDLNTDQRRFVRSATEDLDHLVRAMTDLTSLWVTSASVFWISSGPVDLACILEQSTLYAKPIADRVPVSLQIETGDPSPSLVGDHELLVKAVRNVLINALQHTPPGGTIWIRAYRLDADGERASDEQGAAPREQGSSPVSHGSVVIEVQDSGAGIRPQERNRIFRAFQRSSAGDSSVGALDKGGMGMGLAIASDIAQTHGGSLSYRDVPDRGSCFVFQFPLSEDHVRGWMVRATQRAIDDVRSLRVPLTAVLLQFHSSEDDPSDHLLSGAQQLAVENLRPSDTVLAIDNQLLLLMRGGTRATGYAVIGRIMRSLIQASHTNGSVFENCGVRVGVATYPHDGRDAESVLDRIECECHAFPGTADSGNTI